MFSTACRQLVNEFGKDTLIPVRGLDEEGKVKLLQLVVMKEKRGFFHFNKYSFHPTDFQLTDVLQDISPISVKPDEAVLCHDYQRRKLVSIKGKFGFYFFPVTKIGSSNTETLLVDFNTVAKTQVEKQVLMKEFETRKLNLKHTFIKQVLENKKKKVLGLVTGVVRLTGKGQISRDNKLDANADATAAETRRWISAHTTFKLEKNKNLVLDSNTALAYNVDVLKVNVEDGSTEIMTDRRHGGFYEPREIEADYFSAARHMQDIDFHHRKEIFEPILNLSDIDFHHRKEVLEPILNLAEEDRKKLTSVILEMMSVPRDIQIFIKLVKKLESKKTQDINVQELEKQLLTEKRSWLYLINLAGITVQASGIELSDPNEDTPLLTCFGVLFDALSGLQEEELDLIGKCETQTLPALFVSFEAGLSETEVSVSDKDVETISKDGKAIELLKQLGYSVSEQKILPPKDRLLTIDEVYVVMFALWGQKSK